MKDSVPVPARAIRHESLRERVRKELRNAIVVGHLAPGALYSVQALADNFEVSRTPVREALLDLEGQGMVRFERNRGFRILETSIHDLEEIFTLRLLLEVPATYRAALQMSDGALRQLRITHSSMVAAAERGREGALWNYDRAFHVIILQSSGNRRLATYVDHLRDLVITRGASTVGRSRSMAEVVAEHQEIFAHIENRDGPAAARSMRIHIAHTGQLLISQEGGDPEALADAWSSLGAKGP